MAQCSAQDLIAQACASGFTCRNEPELLALLNQLLCNYTAAGGGSGVGGISGAGSPAGVVTPAAVGQTYTDTVAPYGFWTAVGLTSADWIQVY